MIMLKNTAFRYTFWYEVSVMFLIQLILSPESHRVLPLVAAQIMLVSKGGHILCCAGRFGAF